MEYKSGEEIGIFTVLALWDNTAIYVELPDGTDFLLQENGYTKKDVRNFYAQGCKFYID